MFRFSLIKMFPRSIIVFIFCILYFVCGMQSMQRITIDGQYDESMQLGINNTCVYIIEYPKNDAYPIKVTVESPDSTWDNPLLITALQKERVTSWQLPHISSKENSETEFHTSGHILCPDYSILRRNTSRTSNIASNPLITIKAPGMKHYKFSIKVEVHKDFFIKKNKTYNTTVAIGQPIYYFYKFDEVGNNKENSMLVQATSPDELCMFISVQYSKCPVFDEEDNVKYNSYWQTMNQNAGILVSKKMYPHGFFIVLVVKADDYACTRDYYDIHYQNQSKIVSVKVTSTITKREHTNIILATLFIFVGFFVFSVVGTYIYFKIKSRQDENNDVDTQNSEDVTDFFFQNSSKRYYVWHVSIVTMFYVIPVIQLFITYLKTFHKTGNQDLCYYNFLCSHQLGYVNDFNHILSNAGYFVLGWTFILITYIKRRFERKLSVFYLCSSQDKGSSQKHKNKKSYGIYYALGLALMVEGVMSALYHVCPKAANFQFDTSFMYVMTVLTIVNLHENRYKEGDQRGYIVFGLLGGITAINTLSLLIGKYIYFWVIFAMLQISTCLYFTWYLAGSKPKPLHNTNNRDSEKSLIQAFASSEYTYLHICQIVLLLVGNIINLAIISYGLYIHNGFSTYLLIILIANAFFYTKYYVVMKFCHKEKILYMTWVFILISGIAWGFALYFFVTRVSAWDLPPAESRNLNKECAVLGYYDNHDIWHFLSAVALFFTFLVLLTLDDGLSDTYEGPLERENNAEPEIITEGDKDNEVKLLAVSKA